MDRLNTSNNIAMKKTLQDVIKSSWLCRWMVLLITLEVMVDGYQQLLETGTASSILNVTVVGSMALVQRHLIVPLENFQNSQFDYMECLVNDLPTSLLDHSVRITGTGPGTILGSEITERTVGRSNSATYQSRLLEAKSIISDLTFRASEMEMVTPTLTPTLTLTLALTLTLILALTLTLTLTLTIVLTLILILTLTLTLSLTLTLA